MLDQPDREPSVRELEYHAPAGRGLLPELLDQAEDLDIPLSALVQVRNGQGDVMQSGQGFHIIILDLEAVTEVRAVHMGYARDDDSQVDLANVQGITYTCHRTILDSAAKEWQPNAQGSQRCRATFPDPGEPHHAELQRHSLEVVLTTSWASATSTKSWVPVHTHSIGSERSNVGNSWKAGRSFGPTAERCLGYLDGTHAW
jgi:hypothetical protein